MSKDNFQWSEAAKDGWKEPIVTVGPKINRMRIKIDDWATINAATVRFQACKVADDILKSNALADALFMGWKPPTKWQKRKRRIKEFFGRFKLAYRALRGDDLSFED